MAKKEEKNNKDGKGNGEDRELKDRMSEEVPGGQKEKSQSGGKTDEEVLRELQEEIDKLTSKDIIIQIMMSLSSLAYKKMGLPVGVNDKYKDRIQAKLAVDGFDALLKVIYDEVSASERENLGASLSNLQLNFVKAFS